MWTHDLDHRRLHCAGSIVILGALAAAAIGQTYTRRMSVTSTGGQGANWKRSILSAMTPDGRFVAFASEASLDSNRPNTTGVFQIYVRDRDTDVDGIFDESAAVKTVMVSINNSAGPADGDCGDVLAPFHPLLAVPGGCLDISDNGRYVCFVSNADNLHPIDDDWGDGITHVYVHDRDADNDGIFDESTPGACTTTLMDACDDGTVIGRAWASTPYAAMSADGAYVVFFTYAGLGADLCEDRLGNYAVFLVDVSTGAITNVNSEPALCDPSRPEVVEAGGTEGRLAITPEGRYIAYGTYIWDRTFGCQLNQEPAIVVYDSLTAQKEIIRYLPIPSNADALLVNSISADGQLIAFYSWANNLVTGDTNGYRDCFIYDRGTGATTRVSLDSAGQQGDGHSVHPQISRDGRYVTFYSDADLASPSGVFEDVFLRDIQTGTTSVVSLSNSGQPGNGGSHASIWANYWYDTAAVSSNGRYVAFASYATNLVAGDTNAAADVFVRRRDCAGLITCDANCDGTVDALDIEPFLLAMNDLVAYAQQYPYCDYLCNTDINGDGFVDSLDIEPFLDCLFP